MERCHAPQNGTPLHRASSHGHTAVVEQLLAAGALNDVTTEVSRAGVRHADRAGSKGDTRRVVKLLVLIGVGLRSKLCGKFGLLRLVKGQPW